VVAQHRQRDQVAGPEPGPLELAGRVGAQAAAEVLEQWAREADDGVDDGELADASILSPRPDRLLAINALRPTKHLSRTT
jgi:hypothetical protein